VSVYVIDMIDMIDMIDSDKNHDRKVMTVLFSIFYVTGCQWKAFPRMASSIVIDTLQGWRWRERA
jgi:hypothetical protein